MATIYQNKEDELKELVELAERVFERQERLKNSLTLFFSSFIILGLISLGVFFYIAWQIDDGIKFTYLINVWLLLLGVILLNFYSYYNFIKLRGKVAKENQILSKLFEIIDFQKQETLSELSVIEKAILEMRLSRLTFNDSQSLAEKVSDLI